MEKLTQWISESFIWGIGITRPKPGQERLAAQFITAMLFGALAFLVLLVAFVITRL